MFGMNWRKSRKTLETHLRRVLETWYEERGPACACCEEYCYRGSTVDFIDGGYYCSDSGRFEITLHPRFVEQVKQSPRCPLAIVRLFIRDQQFAPLDLYFWYCWALRHGWTDVDPFSDKGPYSLLSIASAGPKQRSDLQARHERVVTYDRDTPFQLVGRGALRRIQLITATGRRLSNNLALIARAGLRALARLDPRERAKLPKRKQTRPRRNGRESRAIALEKLRSQSEAIPVKPGMALRLGPPDPWAIRSSLPRRWPDGAPEHSRPGVTAGTARPGELVASLLSLDMSEVRQTTAAIRQKLHAIIKDRERTAAKRSPRSESRQAASSRDKTRKERDQAPSTKRERGPP